MEEIEKDTPNNSSNETESSNAKQTCVNSNSHGVLWTKDELDVFRDGYFNLKKRAVHFLLLLSESKNQVKELKRKCKDKESIITNQNRMLNEQKKQNLKLNATIRELRTDVQMAAEKIQLLTRLDGQLKDSNKFLKVELVDERAELAKTREMCRKLSETLNRQKEETKLGYLQRENLLKAKYLHDIGKLEKENEALRSELEKQRNHSEVA